ncbi:Forkhead box protein I1 [Smittium mucronatum]|uniref:Forkhead box protein I1 n=1 Tax=Smittium mucronatum TaxID=133383 RepID=A0A1R0GRP4_9FUNG|nr:Forkhead box protein I1 [Smittium mucronatum]
MENHMYSQFPQRNIVARNMYPGGDAPNFVRPLSNSRNPSNPQGHYIESAPDCPSIMVAPNQMRYSTHSNVSVSNSCLNEPQIISNLYLLPKNNSSSIPIPHRTFISPSHVGYCNSFPVPHNGPNMSSGLPPTKMYLMPHYPHLTDPSFSQFLAQSRHKSFDSKKSMDRRCSLTDLAVSKKPDYSYASLIAQALNDSPSKKRTLNEIYEFILEKYPYYRTHEGWQNSIRHNLSLHKGFTKTKREENIPGKGHFWSITEGFEKFFVDGHFKSFKSKSKDDIESPTNDLPESSNKSADASSSPVKTPKLKKVSNFTEEDLKELRRCSSSILNSSKQQSSKNVDSKSMDSNAPSTVNIPLKRAFSESMELINHNVLSQNLDLVNRDAVKLSSDSLLKDLSAGKLRSSKSYDYIESKKESENIPKLGSPKSFHSLCSMDVSFADRQKLFNNDILFLREKKYSFPSQNCDYSTNPLSTQFINDQHSQKISFLGDSNSSELFNHTIVKSDVLKGNDPTLGFLSGDIFPSCYTDKNTIIDPSLSAQNNGSATAESEHSSDSSPPDLIEPSHTHSAQPTSVGDPDDFQNNTSYSKSVFNDHFSHFQDSSIFPSNITSMDNLFTSSDLTNSYSQCGNSSTIYTPSQIDVSTFPFGFRIDDLDYFVGRPIKKQKLDPTSEIQSSLISTDFFNSNHTFNADFIHSQPRFDEMQTLSDLESHGLDNSQNITATSSQDSFDISPDQLFKNSQDSDVDKLNFLHSEFSDSFFKDICNNSTLCNSSLDNQTNFGSLLNDSASFINFPDLDFNY